MSINVAEFAAAASSLPAHFFSGQNKHVFTANRFAAVNSLCALFNTNTALFSHRSVANESRTPQQSGEVEPSLCRKYKGEGDTEGIKVKAIECLPRESGPSREMHVPE